MPVANKEPFLGRNAGENVVVLTRVKTAWFGHILRKNWLVVLLSLLIVPI